MKILLINYTDSGGGAAAASYSLLVSLRSIGISAYLGVVKKQTNHQYVIQLAKKKNFILKLEQIFYKAIEFILLFRFKTTNSNLHSLNLFSQIDINLINKFDCDIVNLHWIGNNTLSIKDISKINKKIVWTLHDSWACCGAEHHPNLLENDRRYLDGYLTTNKPDSTTGFDICRFIWNLKKKYLSEMSITFTAPSTWQSSVLSQSSLFSKKPCFKIPNIIDEFVFHKLDDLNLRRVFNIPQNKIVIGFGAAFDVTDDKSIKGSSYLLKALKLIENKNDYYLIVFGPANPTFFDDLNIDHTITGYITNPNLLALVYNCCDLFLCPSIVESFSLTSLEAIACGTPVCAFGNTGVSDIIDHMENGYLADAYDVVSFVAGIKYISQNVSRLQEKCLTKKNKYFSTSNTVDKYRHAFTSALHLN